jgi:hypothetical protein
MINTSLKELGTALAQGKVSSRRTGQRMYLDRIDSLNPKLNASSLLTAKNAGRSTGCRYPPGRR